jgi:hypothetical protein
VNGINVFALVIAIVAGAAVGALWYSPVLFLRPWSRAAGRRPAQGGGVYAVTFLSQIVGAFCFAWILGPQPTLIAGILTGFIVGTCFAAASLAINYAFAARGMTLWLIDGGFHVARFLVFGLVLGLMH